jgi:hypothetical protein
MTLPPLRQSSDHLPLSQLHPTLKNSDLCSFRLRAVFSPAHPLARRDVPLAQARASKSFHVPLREWPRLPFTARIGRAPLHRARSASKKGTWPLPPHPSEAAHCASTGMN